MRDRFKLLVHESTGQKYEDLFVKIMGYSDSSFRPVKAHGNIGDRGNDGCCLKTGKYYQVYAPENLPSNNTTSIKKMKEDFNKLKAYWDKISPIKEYYFVVNDKYKGISPHIYDAINEIKIEHTLQAAGLVLSQQLEDILFSLSDDIIQSVVGSSPAEDKSKSVYKYLVDKITQRMHLQSWPLISDNLITESIEFDILDGFSDVIILVFRTVFPNTIPPLERSIQELANRAEALRNHFTKSQFAYLSDDTKWWRKDMRWRQEWINDQNEYNRKYELSDNWRKQLLSLHLNFVHALNCYSHEVRAHVYPNYFMGQQFTVVDSLGTYNSLEGYEAIPGYYREIK